MGYNTYDGAEDVIRSMHIDINIKLFKQIDEHCVPRDGKLDRIVRGIDVMVDQQIAEEIGEHGTTRYT